MNTGTRNAVLTGLVVATLVGTIALGANVTLPFAFSAGTTAKASEVNANFAAVKSAVDDGQSQISSLGVRVAAIESRGCQTATTRVGGVCAELTYRSAAFFIDAALTCVAAGGDLCPQSVLAAVCRDSGTFPSFGGSFGNKEEWAQGNPIYKEPQGGAKVYYVPTISLDSGLCYWHEAQAFDLSDVPIEKRAFRCCFTR